MEISLRSSLEASVESEGAVVVPSKLLADLVRLLPADDVSIEHRSGEGIVEIVSGAATYRLHTYNAEDFPRLPDASSVELMTVMRTRCSRLPGVSAGRLRATSRALFSPGSSFGSKARS